MSRESRTAKSRNSVKPIKLLAAAFGLMLSLGASAYGDIVADGNFEGAAPGAPTGTTYFNAGSSIDGGSWLVTEGTVGVDTQNFYIFDGNKSVFLNGDRGGPDSLTQTLTTVAGGTYDIGFWADADVTNTFSLTFGGVAVTGAPSSIAENGFPSGDFLGNTSQFVFYSGTAMATSTSSDLVFTATGFPSQDSGVTVEIDDVSVTPSSAAPEPAGIAYLLAGCFLGAAGFAVRRQSGATSRA